MHAHPSWERINVHMAQEKTLEALELRDYAMTLTEAHEDFPRGHRAIKGNGKAYVFLGDEKNAKELSMSVKLPGSCHTAVDLPFVEPTGYTLAKSGWGTARFTKTGDVPMDLFRAWIEESYRAIAPKKLVKTL